MNMQKTCLALSLPAVPASVRKARVSVGETAACLGANQRVVDDIRLCVSEAVSNVVRHAYGTRPGDVDVVVEREDKNLRVVVRDEGQGMRHETSKRRDDGGLWPQDHRRGSRATDDQERPRRRNRSANDVLVPGALTR